MNAGTFQEPAQELATFLNLLSSNVLFIIEPATGFIITHYIYIVMSINMLCLRAENT